MSGVTTRRPGEPVIVEFDLINVDGSPILPDVLSLSRRNSAGVISSIRIDLTDTVAPTIELTLVGSLITPSINDPGALWALYVDGVARLSGLSGPYDLNDLGLPTGTYQVSAAATDGSGNTSALTEPLSVSVVTVNNPPVASYTQLIDGLSVTLDASASSDPDGDALTYSWTLGDGFTAQGVSVSHIYAAAGNYTVTLTVADSEFSATESKLLSIVAAPVEPEPDALVESYSFTGFTVRVPTVIDTFTFSTFTIEGS